MKRIILALILVAGCAHKPTLSQAVDAQHLAMRTTAVAAEGLAQLWSALVDAQEAYCRAQDLPDTPEARAECMGAMGNGEAIEEDLAIFAAAYDESAAQLATMRSAAKRIDAFIQGASQ